MFLTLLMIFRIILNSLLQKHKTLTEDLPIEIYPKKIKNRIVFKIKTGYKLELLTPETMRLLGSTKKVVDANKNGKIVLKLESVEVVQFIVIQSKTIINTNQKFYLVLFRINNLDS